MNRKGKKITLTEEEYLKLKKSQKTLKLLPRLLIYGFLIFGVFATAAFAFDIIEDVFSNDYDGDDDYDGRSSASRGK